MIGNYRQLLRPRARWSWAVWLLALALLGGAAWVGVLAVRSAEQAQRWQATQAVVQARLVRRPPPQPSRAAQDERLRWEALAVERAFSWYPVFRALEQASSPEIELLEFLPDKTNRRLTLRGEARTMEGLTAYLTKLGAQAPLTEVYLAKQKNISRAGMSLVAFEVRTRLTGG